MALFALTTPSMAIEEPAYAVVERDEGFELRDYPAVLVAETEVEASFERAGNAAFGRLFRYISGANVGQV
ncbi:MAG: heme-binding protein, partial [Steroidobacteraceae bacterium]